MPQISLCVLLIRSSCPIKIHATEHVQSLSGGVQVLILMLVMGPSAWRPLKAQCRVWRRRACRTTYLLGCAVAEVIRMTYETVICLTMFICTGSSQAVTLRLSRKSHI
jgi:hypothetical protein